MTKKTRDDWKKIYPDIAMFLIAELGQDFQLFGDNLKEIIANYVSENYVEVSEETFSELESLLPLLRSGKIDPDQMLKELRADKLYEYDDVPTLQYFEDIYRFFKEDIKQKIKEEGQAEA